MPRVRLNIDSMSYEIDTRSPETLARWLIEVFDSVHWTPATYARVESVFPSAMSRYDERTGQWDMDWIADTRFWISDKIESPRDFVKALSDQLDRYEGAKL